MDIERKINKQVRCYNCGKTASADIFTEITSLEFKDIIDPDVKPTHRCKCGSTAYQIEREV